LRISYEKMSAPCPGQLSAAQLGNILRAHQSVVLYGFRCMISATCADQLEATSKRQNYDLDELRLPSAKKVCLTNLSPNPGTNAFPLYSNMGSGLVLSIPHVSIKGNHDTHRLRPAFLQGSPAASLRWRPRVRKRVLPSAQAS
jgi:hypothetical protein